MTATARNDEASTSTNRPTISEPINSKLGPLIHGWSIPAVATCPGRSHLCENACYACTGYFIMPTVRRCHERSFEFSKTDGFAEWMTSTCKSRFIRNMRVHVSGDFYDVPYTRKWIEIAKAARHTKFFAYTRSWRCDDILPELIQWSRLPNVVLWWSIDRETGPAPLIPGIRRAYMAIDDVDTQHAPDDCDLIFRENTHTVIKYARDVLVCPVENGVTQGVTCSKCGICWDKLRAPRWERFFPEITGADVHAPEPECLTPT